MITDERIKQIIDDMNRFDVDGACINVAAFVPELIAEVERLKEIEINLTEINQDRYKIFRTKYKEFQNSEQVCLDQAKHIQSVTQQLAVAVEELTKMASMEMNSNLRGKDFVYWAEETLDKIKEMPDERK